MDAKTTHDETMNDSSHDGHAKLSPLLAALERSLSSSSFISFFYGLQAVSIEIPQTEGERDLRKYTGWK